MTDTYSTESFATPDDNDDLHASELHSSLGESLGAQASGRDYAPYKPLHEYSLTATTSPNPQFQFDRDARFGYRESLSYQIVVDWVIAEHKSQGLFQTRCQQDRFERFWLFSVNRSSANGETASLFTRVAPNPGAGKEMEITGVSSHARR